MATGCRRLPALLRPDHQAGAHRGVRHQSARKPDPGGHRPLRKRDPRHFRHRRHQQLYRQAEADIVRLPRSGADGPGGLPCLPPERKAALPVHDLVFEPAKEIGCLVKIYAIDRQGKEHTLEGRDGWSVMEILRDGGLDIAAECGGACACATCHVYVNDGWFEKLPAPSEAEIDMLDMALAVEPNSRLSCQVICSDTTDGIKVTVAPE